MILFFFQAEDGIRDKLVTGVQTCALPISTTAAAGKWTRTWASSSSSPPRSRRATTSSFPERHRLDSAGSMARILVVDDDMSLRALLKAVRSEERRVGKECGCGWVSEQCGR